MTLHRRHAQFALFSLVLVVLALEPIRLFVAFSLKEDEYNSHSSYILLIPFISAGLIYYGRKRIFSNLHVSPWQASLAFLTGGLFSYLGYAYRSQLDETGHVELVTLALIAFWFGGFLLSYGSTAFKAALFPLLFLGVAVPIPNRAAQELVLFLQKGSADIVSVLFALTRTPAYRTNMVFTLPGFAIQVAEACSGIRSTLGMFVVTLLAAHLLLRSRWKKTALLVAVIPVSLFKNAVRIVTLTLLAIHYDMGFLKGSLHHEGGIVFMLAGLCLMYPLLLILIRSEEKMVLERGVRS
jgi:exosortase